MNTLMNAWNQEGRTDNGMKTNLTSENPNLDFFFLAGASRGKDITPVFVSAAGYNTDRAIRTMLWMRDVRGGAGERQQFRNLLKFLAQHESNKEVVSRIIQKVPEIGRWDDLLCLQDTFAEEQAISSFGVALRQGDSLAAKWLPRKGTFANKLRKHMKMTPKQYRKTLVELTKVVETQMCNKDWGKIEYGHVPSVAAARYQRAFAKHDPIRYEQYRENVSKGKDKVNASAVFPHDVVKACRSGGHLADEQWKALPDYMEGSDGRILPVCDVSGSMTGLPMDVSVALGLYISERNNSVFKDVVCFFSEQPNLVKLQAEGLHNRIKELENIPWGMNTNLNAVFSRILDAAKSHNVAPNEMPTKVLIISDMEFDRCVNFDQSAFSMIQSEYSASGYELPKVVFWNVNGRVGNIPVRESDKGVALVSGFSPSILKSILGAGEFTPESIMLETIMNSRYDW